MIYDFTNPDASVALSPSATTLAGSVVDSVIHITLAPFVSRKITLMIRISTNTLTSFLIVLLRDGSISKRLMCFVVDRAL